ncbi:unnamed protein product [Rotaria sp. Silwood1]|nr:unnamed protein product [Rotaria sp. Silwood1]CAF1619886.1 unnamed protein product [Rotaria sp. Silwood1]CAF3710395.1 unnamed protein product [Rotaria sp. Silwood1]CAF3769191.1 unnamed protein product [Rotaria sp. Silwood1]
MNNSFIVDYGGNTDGDDDLPPSVTEVDSDSNSMAQMKDFNKTIHELYEQFSCLLKRKKLANQLNDPVSVQELIIEAERLSIVEKAPFYIAKCLFTDQIVKEIGESTKLIDGSVATKIRNCAKKFIEWLRTAEEGSDQDDDRS